MTAGLLTQEARDFIDGEAKGDLRKAFDEIHRAGRLNLALHRMVEAGAGIAAPETLIAWEVNLALASAIERLGKQVGYTAEEEDFEV